MDAIDSDLKRLKREYDDRRVRLQDSDVYSPLNSAYLFMIQQRQRAAISLLKAVGIRSLNEAQTLEVGCGQGDVLQELTFQRMGSRNLHGAELMPNRLAIARRRFPGVNLVVADGQHLPYPTARFDLALQYTMFSSIMDEAIKTKIAAEMLRVVKPDGLILWYDFWLNPTNRQTKGIRKAEVRALFPDCDFMFRRITLAPPLARMLVPLSWGLSSLLEKLIIFNTHILAVIRPKKVL